MKRPRLGPVPTIPRRRVKVAVWSFVALVGAILVAAFTDHPGWAIALALAAAVVANWPVDQPERTSEPEPDNRFTMLYHDEPGPLVRTWCEENGFKVVVDPACPPGTTYVMPPYRALFDVTQPVTVDIVDRDRENVRVRYEADLRLALDIKWPPTDFTIPPTV